MNFNLNIFFFKKGFDGEIFFRENMLNNLSICENFVYDFKKDNSENLLFYGFIGLGKIYMCNCIVKELLDKGNVVIY